MAFSLFGKKPPVKPAAKGPAVPRKPVSTSQPVTPIPSAEEDDFSLDFTNYAPPVTVMTEPPASEAEVSEPPTSYQPAPASAPALDFAALAESAPALSEPASAPKGASVPAAASGPPDSILLTEMETGAQEVPTVIEEAAVLFANGQAQEALDTLDRAIEADVLEGWTLPAWLMRFDLYQQLVCKSEFEEKALQFVVKFERSPPAWIDLPEPAGVATRPGGSAHIALSGSLGANSAAAFTKMMKAAERHPKLHLDFARLEGADAEGCALLLDTFRALRKAKKEVYVSGEGRALEVLRTKAIAGDASAGEPLWLLLLDLYQQLGLQNEFEEAAIDYAVTFEVSPPSWEARPRVQPIAPAPAAASGRRDGSDDSYRLEGEIAGEQGALFAALLKYVQQANPAVIDLACVRRIDFINAGRLLHVVEKACEAKHPVVLRAVGEMLTALFAVMGIHKLARIVPRK